MGGFLELGDDESINGEGFLWSDKHVLKLNSVLVHLWTEQTLSDCRCWVNELITVGYSSQYFYYVFKIRWYGYECRHGYHVWRPKDYLCRLIPSYHLGAGDWTQVTRLGCKCLYLLSHLTVPKTFCLFKSRGISGTNNGKNTNAGACSGKTEHLCGCALIW